MPDPSLQGLDQLKISAVVRDRLAEFATQLIGFYQQDLVSIAVFGSAVSGDYSEKISDLNLLVVYTDLNIANLEAVASLAQRWLKKQRFMPRFLSHRNLANSARYFQIDLLDMRDAHVTIFGEDVLDCLELRPADLRWQLAHEIKRMRMRLKQQFWRAAGDQETMRLILVRRFTSLVHLTRALLVLRGQSPPLLLHEILALAVRELGVNAQFAAQMADLKAGRIALRKEQFIGAFSRLMDAVRTIDEHVDRLVI